MINLDEEAVKPCIQDRLRALFSLNEKKAISLSVTVIMIIIGLFYVPPLRQYWDSFYPAVMATFLGIFLGFTLDRILVMGQRKYEVNNLLKGIRNELEYIRSRIYPQTRSVFLIESPEWDSAISSGQLQLLKIEERRALSIVYTTIKYNNYDAMHVTALKRDVGKGYINDSVYNLSLRNHNGLGEELTREIEKVLKMDFFVKLKR